MIEDLKKGRICKEEPTLIKLSFLIFYQASWSLEIIYPAYVLNQTRVLIFQGKCDGKRQARRILAYTFEIVELCDTINVISTLMVLVITQFIHYIDHDQDETCNTCRQTNDIDKGIGFSFDQKPEGCPEKIK